MAGQRANWDYNLTKKFLDLCIAEKDKLNFNCKKGLTKVGWNNLYRNFRQQTGRNYDNKQFQNKFNSLKRLYSTWRKLRHHATGGGCDNSTGTIVGEEEWWKTHIAEDQEAEQLRQRTLEHEHELSILFGTMNTEEGDMLCAGGIGDKTPSRGSEDNHDLDFEDNIGLSSVGHVAHRSGKEQEVDSPPTKKTEMSTSETSSNTSSTQFEDESSSWWDMGGTVGVLAAVASSNPSGCRLQGPTLSLQELTGRQWVALNLANSKKCYKNFCFHPDAFKLHTTLVASHGLKSTIHCGSIEALAMFLWARATRQSHRQMSERFGRSQDTVSRKFGEVLDAMVSFAHTAIRPKDPRFRSVHAKLQRYSPYFDGCIGAIDGTHIPVTVQD